MVTTIIPLARRGRITVAIVLIAIILICASAVRFSQSASPGSPHALTDFDAFHIAGRLAAHGRLTDAYDARSFFLEQRRVSGTPSFMPWTYPPPFTAFAQGLSLLPIGMSYALFAGLSFAFYLIVLRRICGEYLPGVLIAVAPVIIINLRIGQNGFLISGLIGAFLLAAFGGRDQRAGAILGLLIIKPHLAVSIGIIALWRRSIGLVAMAVTIAVLLIGLVTWFYGAGVWSLFFSAMREATGFLQSGYYQLFRMSSVYATLFSFGLSSAAAMAGQALCAGGALVLFGFALTRGMPTRYIAALACICAVLVSPYCYDYDLAILGIGIAFIIPDLLARAGPGELACLTGLTWFAGGYGLATKVVMEKLVDTGVAGSELSTSPTAPALIAPALLAACLWAAVVLRREPR